MANKRIDEQDLEQISGGGDGVVLDPGGGSGIPGPGGPGAGSGPEKGAFPPRPPIIGGPIGLSKDTKADESIFDKDDGNG